MSSKAKEEVNVKLSFELIWMMTWEFLFELRGLASNIRLEVFGVLDSFLSFMRTYDEKKTCNMLVFMLDPRFKNFCLVFSYVGKQ